MANDETTRVKITTAAPVGTHLRLTVEAVPDPGAPGGHQTVELNLGQTNSPPVPASSLLSRQPQWEWWLFAAALIIYALTRLIGLEDFPLYFFVDEAVQTLMAEHFVHNGLTNYEGEFLPTYFQPDPTYNQSCVTVYQQIIPYLLFGKSVLVTRAVSALVAALAVVAVGLTLRQIFQQRYWWCGMLLFSALPVWFLHTRTAFEPVTTTAMYGGCLYFYLLYRYRAPVYLYATLVFGALTFYTYGPAQFLMPVTAVCLLASDWRYHWQHRRNLVRGAGLLLLLALWSSDAHRRPVTQAGKSCGNDLISGRKAGDYLNVITILDT